MEERKWREKRWMSEIGGWEFCVARRWFTGDGILGGPLNIQRQKNNFKPKTSQNSNRT